MAETNRGFDVLGTAYDPSKDYVAALVQCFQEINSRPAKDNPGVDGVAGRFICKRHGDRVMLEYHLMDLYLDDNARCEDLAQSAYKALASLASQLKKDFKKRTKTALKLKEHKASAGWHREQASLNGQWYMRCWRVYDVSPEADQSEEV